MTETEPLDQSFEARIDRSMHACPRCVPLDRDQRDAHRLRSLREVLRTQSRTLTPLPTHVWNTENWNKK